LRVVLYRLALRLGIHPAQQVTATMPKGTFFGAVGAQPIAATVPSNWADEALLFGAHPVAIGAEPPAWTVDPLAHPKGSDVPPDELSPWWRIPDFAAGDIKRIWELSRFDWAMIFAQRARNGDTASLERLNRWIEDWCERNPPYRGPNWKCAQEASIRLLHVAIAALILGEEGSMPDPLRAFVDAHVRRILPTLSYARAQDNNHATSEAASLFVAGTWLQIAGKPEGGALARRGRRLLEQHVGRLFTADGSFSQYSLNYHRVALDTLSIVELWRDRSNQPPFTKRYQRRAAAASDWLRVMVDAGTGDAPNLGANDGANLLPLTDSAYRDHRPSVQLATALFQDARAYPAGPWDEMLKWLRVDPRKASLTLPTCAVFDEGGYAVLRSGQAMTLLRFPRFRFRPSQADALHVDLWLGGDNLLRDAGSYSYNTDAEWIEYFGGAEGHNTIQFDGEPQMPRLSRFLLGDWLRAKRRRAAHVDAGQAFAASYRHRRGWQHAREARLGSSLLVVDEVSGFTRQATLRWRLRPGPWRVEGTCATDGHHRLEIRTDVPVETMQLVPGWESRHYLEKTAVPVLEVTVSAPGTITSEYRWTL
jgi:hypothetical protein